MNQPKKPAPNPFRRILVTEPDIDAARHLLSLLALEEHPQAQPLRNRRERVLQAQAALNNRHRRFEILGKPFAESAPFALLLALYSIEDREKPINLTRARELALLTQATALRWVDVLEAAGWIERSSDADDARKVLLSLSTHARGLLDELFSGRAGSAA